MADCRIVNAAVLSAVQEIENTSGNYKTAGDGFVSALNAAISEMEGQTKDELKRFIDADVNDFVTKTIPEALKGMAELLEANRDNFERVDMQIAASIDAAK